MTVWLSPETAASLGERSCDHCGSRPADRTWDMRPCAAKRRSTYHLCDPCDLTLNRRMLAFFKVANRAALIREYASQGNLEAEYPTEEME